MGYIADRWGKYVTKFDAQDLVEKILNPGTKISMEQVATDYNFPELLEQCYDKDPVRTYEYILQKCDLDMREAYKTLTDNIYLVGLQEGNPEKVREMCAKLESLDEKYGKVFGTKKSAYEREQPTKLDELHGHIRKLESGKSNSDSAGK